MLLRVEERFPREDGPSMLFVVVERDATMWQSRLAETHTELFSHNHTGLLVIDRATADALEAMEKAGLIAPQLRAVRTVHPAADTPAALPHMRERETFLARQLKLAGMLQGEGFATEAVAPLSKALLA